MKTRTKALVLAFSAVLLVVTTVFVTMAFLTDTDKVTNTFTVGKVEITLDEVDVDPYGSPVPSASARVQENDYKLIPGHSYEKDPTVHVGAGSENSWIFVKVENQISDIILEDRNNQPIEKQITKHGWASLTGVENVYYKQYSGNGVEQDYIVFDGFTVKDDVDLSAYANKTIVITAYAVQLDGFDNVADAWDVVKDLGATPTPTANN